MPTYEYVCKTCGESLEVFQSFSDKPLKRHKGCGGDLQKVFHSRGIVFKGSGFYSTDARVPAKSSDGAKPAKKEGKEGKAAKETAKASAPSSSDD